MLGAPVRFYASCRALMTKFLFLPFVKSKHALYCFSLGNLVEVGLGNAFAMFFWSLRNFFFLLQFNKFSATLYSCTRLINKCKLLHAIEKPRPENS